MATPSARLGGDEFVVMLEDLSDRPPAGRRTGRSSSAKKSSLPSTSPIHSHGREYHSTPSIGVTLFVGNQEITVDELLKQADIAMYQAKSAGRNTLRFFDPEMQAGAGRPRQPGSRSASGPRRQTSSSSTTSRRSTTRGRIHRGRGPAALAASGARPGLAGCSSSRWPRKPA